jgi:hypothetical protein
MAVLSKNPKGARDAGTLIIYQKLTASPPADVLSFWELPSYRAQLQPIQLIELGKSWNAVNINIFASADDKFGATHAENEARKFFHTKMEIEPSLLPDLNIIGNSIVNLSNCLRMFGMTLDVLYELTTTVRDAIKGVIQRYIAFIRPHHPGPQSAISGKMFQIIAQDFQTELNKAYLQVYGGAIDSEAQFVTALSTIPDTSSNTKLAVDILRMQVAHQEPAMNTPRLDRTPKKAKQVAIVTPGPAATPTIATTSPTTWLCGYHLSDKKCLKPNCGRPHRSPVTDAEKAIVKKFFDSNRTHKQVVF